VSVVINPVTDNKTLTQLGSPGEVGYQLGKTAIAPPNSGRTAELVNAEERTVGDKLYYLLEYAVKVGDRERHNLASVAVSRGKLYTFNASTPENRWAKMQTLLEKTVKSFSVD
jgi:photosystem II oxygen-evolving enhancer protein 2